MPRLSCTNKLGDDISGRTLFRWLFSEFLGTLLLVLLTCGAAVDWSPVASEIVIDGTHNNSSTNGKSLSLSKSSLVGPAVATGMTITALVNMLGPVSGAHINPAVTLAMVATGKMRPVLGLLYTCVQCLGAIVGSLLLYFITPSEHHHGPLGVTLPAPDVCLRQAFVVEVVATLFLILVVFAVCDEERSVGLMTSNVSVGMTIGFTAMSCVLFAGKFTGCSMNPARSLGPAIVSSTYHHLWVYLTAPLLAGLLGAFLYEGILKERPASNDVLSGLRYRENISSSDNNNSGVSPKGKHILPQYQILAADEDEEEDVEEYNNVLH